jgi:deoxyribodipyrimidine photo-lyase
MILQSHASAELHAKKVLVWLRRDLRLTDHAALSAALSSAATVWCTFIFDREILEPLLARGLKADRRVEFIHHAVSEVDTRLRSERSSLIVRHGFAREEVVKLAQSLGAEAVVTNRDYEPSAIDRDKAVENDLAAAGIAFLTFKDQVIFEKDELRSGNGNFYSVFTPYRRAWLLALSPGHYAVRPTFNGASARLGSVPSSIDQGIPTLPTLGFEETNLMQLGLPLGEMGAEQLLGEFSKRITDYDSRRNFPAIKGPSYLSVHLRFGTISVRAMVRLALAHIDGAPAVAIASGASTWLSELIWRDFYAQILFHRPDVEGHAFRKAYDRISWLEGAEGERRFNAWASGKTGYPLVDAAMRQINSSGYMHNRLRMVTASFLVKDLGIDWRRGEHYFADMLNDYDLASNNGGWQWSASTGCDAQPFFRIFNPVTQSEKFDPEGKFIRLYVPELRNLTEKQIHAPWRLTQVEQEKLGVIIGRTYPAPIVDHAVAREETLARFGSVSA